MLDRGGKKERNDKQQANKWDLRRHWLMFCIFLFLCELNAQLPTRKEAELDKAQADHGNNFTSLAGLCSI